MAATRHQNQALTGFGSLTSQGLTYGTTPTSGRLLVTSISVDKTSGVITVPTGFTLIGTTYVSANVSGAWAYKISTGDEATITWNWATAQNSATIWISEYSGVDTLDVNAADDSGVSSVTSQASGTTAATAVADSLAICMFIADTLTNVEADRAYTNSFAEIAVNTNNSAAGLLIAEKALIATGAQSSVFSTTSAGDQMAGKIAVFNLSTLPTILDIDTDNIVLAGQTNVTINTSNFPTTEPTTWSVTLADEVLTEVSWNSGNPIVSVPSTIDLLWATTNNQLKITYTV